MILPLADLHLPPDLVAAVRGWLDTLCDRDYWTRQIARMQKGQK